VADPTLAELALQFRGQVMRKDAATLGRLTRAYGDIYQRAQDDLSNLVNAIVAKGTPVSKGQIQRMGQYQDLLKNLEREVTQYGGFVQTTTRGEAEGLIAQAGRDARLLIAKTAGGDGAILARLQTLNPKAVQTLLGFLDPGGELWRYWSRGEAGSQAAEAIGRKILENVGMGRNPLSWARDLQRVMGAPLTSALRTARTVQLWSYREANRANYMANSDVVTGWQWVAEMDDKTCGACIALNGRIFALEQSTDGHWNCRCTNVPVTIFTRDTMPSGEDWFKDQPAGRQVNILGQAKYDAWKDGKFEFAKLAEHAKDATFGQMWIEPTLDTLVQ
jgi:SPP1 gp7 family putative phage head morphogenesis protein